MKKESKFGEGSVSIECSCCGKNTASYIFCYGNENFTICYSCLRKISDKAIDLGIIKKEWFSQEGKIAYFVDKNFGAEKVLIKEINVKFSQDINGSWIEVDSYYDLDEFYETKEEAIIKSKQIKKNEFKDNIKSLEKLLKQKREELSKLPSP